MGALDAANWEKYYPTDLAKTSADVPTTQDYFTVPVPNLKTNTGYSFEFQWVYSDGSVSDWSPGYFLNTSNIATLPKPKLTSANISYFQGILKVTWDGTDYNNTSYGNGFSRILIWVRDNTVPGQLFKIVGELSKPGTWSLAVPPKSQTVKLSAISVNGEESPYSDDFTITPVVAPPVAVTGSTATWSGTNFIVDFTHNPLAAENEYLKEYIVTLVGSNFTKQFSLLPVAGTSQRFSLSLEANRAAFGVSQTSFSGNIKTLDIYGNYGSAVTFTAPAYASSLAAPTISATESVNGYSISYTAQTSPDFKEISIEEVVSSSATDPGTGYTGVAKGSSNPIKVESGVGKRWVRARLIDTIGAFSGYSNSVSVTPVDIIAAALDITPPTNAVINSAGWSGNDLVISATVSTDAKKFIIRLTNGSNTAYFTRFPGVAGSSQSITLTQDDLYNSFGQHFTSFSGLFVSADALDNRDSGTPFTVATKTNPLASTTPTFTLTPITNGYTATWTLPASASYAKVYESSTSWGSGNPTESDLVFSGQSPAIIKKTTYTTRYVKIKYVTVDGFNSLWSAEDTVTPVDSISADTNPPNAPSTNLTATPSIDNTGVMGFNGVINLSWAAVSDSSLRGYRIRFRPVTTPASEYSYVDAPSGTSYRLGGLAVGATYEIGIASYDEFNNTTLSYSSFTNQLISGTPAMSNYITAGAAGFQFGSGIKDKTGSQNASAQGVYLSNSNYWYLTSSNSAQFKIGGPTNNYVEWNGTKLTVDGDLGVAGGTTIGGNIAMGTSGASIYQGTLTGGNLTSDGFILNSSGLSIKKGTVNLRLDTTDGGIYAQYGQIAGWTIDSAKIERLTSSKYTGISSSGSYAFYAGATASGNTGGDSSASFWVKPDGSAKATDITITGGSLTVGASSIEASTGKFISTDAEITGKITASTGQIGNLKIDSGALYIGTSPLVGSVVFNSAGIAAYNSSGDRLFALDTTGAIDAKSGLIAGWTLGTSAISKTSGANSISLSSSTNSISATGTSYTAGFGLPDSNNIVFWAGGSRAETANFWVKSDGSAKLGSVTITGYATSGALDGKINTGGAASDVNSNTTTISGSKIRSGSIQSNNWDGSVTDGSNFSTAGMTIDLTTGAITSKKFRIDTSGNASFIGTLSSGISIDAPVITGGSLNIGNGQFTVSTAGALVAQSANITGQITIDSNNTWGPSGFRMGSAGSYITYTGSTVTLKSGTTSNLDDSAGNPDGGGTTPNSRDVNSEIILNAGSTGLSIKGIPSLGNYTRYGGGGLYTNVEANDFNSSYGMGRAARLRTIVQDYYDDRLYRGFAVYYGVRSSAPTGSTGLVGDLWVSW
jgi:hypothetical protein